MRLKNLLWTPGRRLVLLTCLSIGLMLPSTAWAQLGAQGKNWRVNFRTQFEHDSNLAQVSSDPAFKPARLSNGNDSGFTWNGNATYVHQFNDRLRITGDYDIEMHKWDTLNQYDTMSQMYGLKPSYKINDNMFFSFQYFFIWNMATGFNFDTDTFSIVHYVNPSITHMHKKFGMTRLSVRYSYDDNKAINSRDTNTYGFSLDHMYLVTQGFSVGGGYTLRIQDTASPAFDRDVHDFKVKVKKALPAGIDFLGEYKFSLRDYTNLFSAPTSYLANTAGTFEREDAQHNFSFELRKVLWKKLAFMQNVRARLSWIHRYNESNFNFREYQSDIFRGGVDLRF